MVKYQQEISDWWAKELEYRNTPDSDGKKHKYRSHSTHWSDIEASLIRNCTLWTPARETEKPVPKTTITLKRLFRDLEDEMRHHTCLRWDGQYIRNGNTERPSFGLLKVHSDTPIQHVDKFLFVKMFGPLPSRYRINTGFGCMIGRPRSSPGSAWCVNPLHAWLNWRANERAYLRNWTPEYLATLDRYAKFHKLRDWDK